MRIAGMQRLASIDCEKTGVDVIKLSISLLADKVSHLYFLQLDDIHPEIMSHIQSLGKPFKITQADRTYGSGWGFYNNESLDDLYKSVDDEQFDWILYPDTDDLLPDNILDILQEADNINAETIHFYYIECFGAVDRIIEVTKGFPIGPHHKAVKHRKDITFLLSEGFNRALSSNGRLKAYETGYCIRHMRYVTSQGLEKRKSMNYIDSYFLEPHATISFKEGAKFSYYYRVKYKVIVKTTHKHSSRMDNCVNTWLKDVDYICITDKLTGNYNELSVSKNDDYRSNEEKTVNFINLVRTTDMFDTYDWLVFIDDDAILNKPKFEYIAPKLDKNFAYGLIIASYGNEPNLKYLSGGCGYFISPQLIKRCKEMTIKNCGYEDVSMGKWYEENNIELRETYFDDGKWEYIKLNGWFPLQNEYDKVNDGKTGSDYVLKLIDRIKNNNKINDHLRIHCTHHYIKHLPLMDYIHQRFKEWTPDSDVK